MQALRLSFILTILVVILPGWLPIIKAPAQPPAHSFKVLVVASRARDHLKMIAAAKPFLERLAKDNSFSLDFTDDTSRISEAGLEDYQVFVMLHLAPFDMSYSQQAALRKFVEQGKGWVGIHAAGLTGKEFLAPGTRYWQWFEDFMGGVTYSPHPAFQKGTLLIEDHDHPVTRYLPAKLEVSDEWYEFNKSPRSNIRVLASADESSYRQNRPMGDHPLVWTNERYRRMIYIGIGHDLSILQNDGYARLLQDAILWAGSGYTPGVAPVVTRTEAPAIPIPMKGRIISYERTFFLDRDTIDSHKQINKVFNVITDDTGRYYWLKFDADITITGRKCVIRAYNFYEKPIGPGITNDYSKIEYRWWDFRLGKPWSAEDRRLFEGLDRQTREWMDSVEKELKPPRFRVLALYENGGHHVEFSKRARVWLDQLAADSNFTIDYIQSTNPVNPAFLNKYQLIIQLDYVPYGWKDQAMSALQEYIEQGKGGWIGFHHASLLGEFDGYPMWNWFSTFMGGIVWKDYIPGFARGEVRVEDRQHPVMQEVPPTFTIQKEEWYTWDKSPRSNVHVIASVDESSYVPLSDKRMGDHPVIWTNDHVKARNAYIFMGHSPILFDDEVYKRIFCNAIFWAAATATATKAGPRQPQPDSKQPQPGSKQPQPAFKVIAFYSTTVEPDHVDFANDAIKFYSDLAVRAHFGFDTTTNWEIMNDSVLKNCQVVLWLNDFPKNERQRSAFEKYMTGGGAWLGFHVAGYNDRFTKWPWFVQFLGGAVFYNNNWPPLPAQLIVEDTVHPVTRSMLQHYKAPINEWYGWKPSPRLNRDVKVLVTLDTANYPLGKKDIIRSGDIPVVWTNTRYKMLYMNMGHGDKNFTSPVQNTMFENAILWLGTKKDQSSALKRE